MKLKTKIIVIVFLYLFCFIYLVDARRVNDINDTGNGVPYSYNEEQPDEDTDENNLPTYTLNSCNNAAGECFQGRGLRLRLIKYNEDSKSITQVGEPLFILHPSLLAEVVIKNGVNLPNSEADFGRAGAYPGLRQQNLPKELSSSDQYIVDSSKPKTLVHQSGGTYSCRGSDKKAVDNQYLSTKQYEQKADPPHGVYHGYEFQGWAYQFDTSKCKYLKENKKVKQKADGTVDPDVDLDYHPGYERFTFSYISDYKKTRYPKSMILNLPSNYKEDSNLTGFNISQTYIDSLVSKYAGTISSVKSSFGIDAGGLDFTDYYVEVQGVYRVTVDDPAPISEGTFLVKTVDQMTCEEVVLVSGTANGKTSVGYSHNGDNYCEKEELESPEKAAWCEYTVTGKESTVYSNDKDCKGKNYKWHPYQAAKYKCVDERKYYTHPAAYCGTWNYHKIYGKKYRGYSKLLFTKASSTSDCNTSNATTSLADLLSEKRVEHCNITDASKNYTQQELNNDCAGNGFKHYIGPDSQRALVGEIARNKYNLFGVVGSSKCITGVRHYYLLDIPEPNSGKGKTCKSVCGEGGSSDEFLACAENFCDHDVDYTLGGQPFNRKRECVIKICGYNYGRVPTMGSDSGTARQAVSSCANATVFKKGSGSSYEPDNNILDSSASKCGIKNGKLIGNYVAKDSICIGDKVTDYDPSDDTTKNDKETGLDQRSYINIACQETDRIEKISDISGIYKNGESMTYGISTKGNVKCIAFFNFEQWKVDYAIIPSFDTVRRKKLEYIYYTFNNLLNKDYTVPTTVTNFNGVSLDGKSIIDVTIGNEAASKKYGKVNWEAYRINKELTTSLANAYEAVEKEEVQSIKTTSENPMTKVKDTPVTNTLDVIDISDSGDYKIYTSNRTPTGKLIRVSNRTIKSLGELKGYVQDSFVSSDYQFKKYCVDERGIVTPAPSTGICPTSGKIGVNAFYTDLNSIPRNDLTNSTLRSQANKIDSTVKIISSLPTKTLLYQNNDSCKFDFPKGGDVASCYFEVVGDSPALGNYNTDVTLKLHLLKANSDFFTPTDLPNNYNAIVKSPNRTINPSPSDILTYHIPWTDKPETVTAYASFVYEGQNVECSKEVSFINKDCVCDIKKNNSAEYEVVTAGSVSSVWGGIISSPIRYNSSGKPTNLNKLDKLGTGEKFLIKAAEDAVFSDDDIITAHVLYSSGEACSCFSKDQTQCKKSTDEASRGLYLPGEYTKIKKYCTDNFSKDAHDYSSSDECIKDCSPCPTGNAVVNGLEEKVEETKENAQKIENYCKDYSKYGYKSITDCTNQIYKRCINKGAEVKYRPVNINNPFPYAVLNAKIAPQYETGKRPIGSNWRGYEDQITSTDTSNNKAYYKFVLAPDDISKIKSDTESLNTKKYVYTQLNRVSGTNVNNPYKSTYIREKYYNNFCYIQGIAVNGGC